jgi:hypothetical protein
LGERQYFGALLVMANIPEPGIAIGSDLDRVRAAAHCLMALVPSDFRPLAGLLLAMVTREIGAECEAKQRTCYELGIAEGRRQRDAELLPEDAAVASPQMYH